jgi:transcription elongation factor GreA
MNEFTGIIKYRQNRVVEKRMSDSLIDRIESLVTEEMWTRSALSNYSVSQFEELEVLLKEAYNDEKTDEVKALCDKRLTENKNSILAMYLSGVIAWEDQQLEDADLATLISLFAENSKWTIVEYIAKKILSTGENKMALRALAKSYEKQNSEAEQYAVLERLARLDYEDAELVMQLARHFEEKNDEENAVSYYKKAAYRYINRKQFAGLMEVWVKLMQYCGDSDDLFSSIISKTEKSMGDERAGELQKSLYPLYKAQHKWDLSIALLKKLLGVNHKDTSARKELIECYSEKYKNHSRLKECLAISNLAQNWRNVHEAIESFEKHIRLDKNRFVYHRTWGVGRIREINEENVIIDFAKKRSHSMGLEMAISSLLSLDDNHIWVLKATVPRDKLKEKIKKNPAWALKTIASSFNGQTDMKKVKSELSPSDNPKGSLLTASEWSNWSTEARKILRNDPEFGNNASKSDVFTLRTSPVSLEEKLANNFKAEDNFFKRIAILDDFLQAADPGNEYFDEMFNYFFSYLKAGIVNEHVVASYLLIQKLIKSNIVNVSLPYGFAELYNDIADVEATFAKIENAELKEDFLTQVLRTVTDWQEVFLRLLPHYPSAVIIEHLKKEHRDDDIKRAFSLIIERYRTAPDAFFWVSENFFQAKENSYDIKQERIVINLIHLLDITYRNIAARKDIALNKRINRHAQNLLFREHYLADVITYGDKELLLRIYGLLSDVSDLEHQNLDAAINAIKMRFPDIKLEKVTPRQKMESITVSAKSGRGGLVWVTEKSYQAKTAELKHIIEVEIPKNSAEIGEAIKKGDLKENAEYIFGKERQEQLQQEVGRLQKELDNSRIFEADKIDTATISFGTVVTLQITGGKKKETYTILGPWESDPDKKILSYLAPFAEALLGKTVNESVVFKINERTYKYDIIEIKAANLN